MKNAHLWHWITLALVSALLLALLPTAIAAPPAPAPRPTLLFVENVGQFPAEARFQVRNLGQGTLWLAEDALWLMHSAPPDADAGGRGEGVALRLSFPGANPHPRLEPFGPRETVLNYYHGNDPARWHTGVPVWSGVRYVDLYPGLDLEITGQGNQLFWRLTPSLSPFPFEGEGWGGGLQLRVEGADDVTLEGAALRLSTAAGALDLPFLAVDGNPPAAQSEIAAGEGHIFTVTSPISNMTSSPHTRPISPALWPGRRKSPTIPAAGP